MLNLFTKIVVAGCTLTAAWAQQAMVIHPLNFAVSQALGDLAADPFEDTSLVTTQKGLNFDGAGATSYLYPDANGAPGATQYMQWTNARYAVYSKTTGGTIVKPTAAN